MAVEREIEKKFLVVGGGWRSDGIVSRTPDMLFQGYLFSDETRSCRIRVDKLTGHARFCLKTTIPNDNPALLDRSEVEFDISTDENAFDLLEACPYVVEKSRYKVGTESGAWEIDVYLGDNEGLLTAEIEFKDHKDYELWLKIEKPSWLGKDVTADPRYLNANLAKNPWKNWKDDEVPEHCPW